MFRRLFLALTVVAVLGAAGLGVARTADAHGGGYGYSGYRGGYAAYNGYRGVYYGGYPTYYPSPYVAGYTYAPPVVFYPRERHRHRHHDCYRDRGGVTFTIGF